MTQEDVDSCTACSIISRVRLITLEQRGIQQLRQVTDNRVSDSLTSEIIEFHTSTEALLGRLKAEIYDDVLGNLSN